ncbi:MAG: SagB/ThcOx family dehydrogenase [Dehalococcoidales bacterium]|nr:SagB/ThcOx family dehydrogenase [Dehalococcoidales bacterium]
MPLAENIRITIPEPKYSSDISMEEALRERRSIRDYTAEALTLEEVSQLLWAAQGKTSPDGKRTAPSAGATYPLEVYLVAGAVDGIGAGVYRYDSASHELLLVISGDVRDSLAEAALGQACVREAPVNIAITAVFERTTNRYGERGIRYVHFEAGHAAQNVCLQAVAFDLGSVVIGAFYDDRVKKILNLPATEEPLYIIPVGRIAGS